MTTIVVAASGPSITQEQCALTCGHDVIAVSDTYKLLPNARWHYAADYHWWKLHHENVKTPARYTMSKQAAREFKLFWVGTPITIQTVKGHSSSDLGKMPNSKNSGAHAINLAYLLGATRIILIGFDFQHTGGKRHFFGDHPPGFHRNATDPTGWLNTLEPLVRSLQSKGVTILNATIETAIPEVLVPRVDLKGALWHGQAT